MIDTCQIQSWLLSRCTNSVQQPPVIEKLETLKTLAKQWKKHRTSISERLLGMIKGGCYNKPWHFYKNWKPWSWSIWRIFSSSSVLDHILNTMLPLPVTPLRIDIFESLLWEKTYFRIGCVLIKHWNMGNPKPTSYSPTSWSCFSRGSPYIIIYPIFYF